MCGTDSCLNLTHFTETCSPIPRWKTLSKALPFCFSSGIKEEAIGSFSWFFLDFRRQGNNHPKHRHQDEILLMAEFVVENKKPPQREGFTRCR